MMSAMKRSAVSRVQAGGEVVFDAVFLGAAEGVGDDDVEAVCVAVVFVGAAEGVVVADLGGGVDTVQDHVVVQSMQEGFLFDAVDAADEGFFVFGGFNVVAALVVDGAGEEAAGAAGGVEDGFGELRVDAVDDELGDGAGCGNSPALPALWRSGGSARRCCRRCGGPGCC